MASIDDDYPTPDEWHLHSAGSKGVTFRCDFVNDVESALAAFQHTMRAVMDAWPMTTTSMSITIG